MKTVYRSAVDTWLLVVLGAGGLVALVAAAGVFVAGDTAARAIAVLALLLGVGLPLWILTTTSYTLDEEMLLVRSGPFRWRRPLVDITAITTTRNPLSSPALSLDRLRIESRGQGTLMISPADRAGFLADLEARRAAAPPR